MGERTAAVAVAFLGPLVATVDGEPRPVAGRRERHLLCLLASEAGCAGCSGS